MGMVLRELQAVVADPASLLHGVAEFLYCSRDHVLTTSLYLGAASNLHTLHTAVFPPHLGGFPDLDMSTVTGEAWSLLTGRPSSLARSSVGSASESSTGPPAGLAQLIALTISTLVAYGYDLARYVVAVIQYHKRQWGIPLVFTDYLIPWYNAKL